MFSEFAYSRPMQVILAAIACISSFIIIYYISNITLVLYDEKASVVQKSKLAFVVGIILNQAWVYAIYFIGNMHSFSDMMYALVATPNPLFALLYYLLGVRILKLSPVRSIRLMGHVYLYYVMTKGLTRLMGSIFFVQTSPRYNYMLDAMNQASYLLVFFAMYFITRRLIRRFGMVIRLNDNMFVNVKREYVIYILKATMVYALMVGLPRIIHERVVAHAVIVAFILFTLFCSLLLDIFRSVRMGAENKDAHINALVKGIPPPRASGEELGRRINENLSLVTILLDKNDRAKSMRVDMRIALNGSLDDLYIDNLDACVIIESLLDNAIDEACRAHRRWVHFVLASKGADNKLIIVNSSTASPVKSYEPRPGRISNGQPDLGRRISDVRRIIANYGNCAFRVDYYNYEMSAYLEIKEVKRKRD